MAIRTLLSFDEQTGLTGTSDSFILNPLAEASITCRLTAGSPSTGARVQITLDEVDKINAGTATWVDSPLGNHTSSSAEKILRPATGVRLVVTDGTWTLQVRQS